jgi:predicted MFS family arabinose efflux permease
MSVIYAVGLRLSMLYCPVGRQYVCAGTRVGLGHAEADAGGDDLLSGALLKSMGRLALTTPVLQRRALCQACLFGAFSLFWTTVPLLLTGPDFHMSQGGLALFALVGGAGAIAAPLAGRAADRGWTRPATGFAILSVAVAVLVTRFADADAGSPLRIPLLIAAAILLDFGMAANLTLGQRAIFVLGAEYRNRLNGLYLSAFFVGGAVGSALGGWAYAHGG